MKSLEMSVTADAANSSKIAFEFVKALAAELSSGNIDLPSFPDIAMRVQRVLGDDGVSPERVVRVIGGEPALAARILSMANSAALNPSGRQISDLKNAVARLGFDMLRSCAISFSMAQLRKADQFKAIEKPMNLLWQRSIQVAALSFVIAKRHSRLIPDVALLAGLLHGVGKLYILTRASKFPALFSDQSSYNVIVRDWHSGIAKALLETWEIAPQIVDAIESHDCSEREVRGAATLADILAVGSVFASLKDQPDLLEATLLESKSAKILNIDRQAWQKILQDSAAEIAALREALGN